MKKLHKNIVYINSYNQLIFKDTILYTFIDNDFRDVDIDYSINLFNIELKKYPHIKKVLDTITDFRIETLSSSTGNIHTVNIKIKYCIDNIIDIRKIRINFFSNKFTVML